VVGCPTVADVLRSMAHHTCVVREANASDADRMVRLKSAISAIARDCRALPQFFVHEDTLDEGTHSFPVRWFLSTPSEVAIPHKHSDCLNGKRESMRKKERS